MRTNKLNKVIWQNQAVKARYLIMGTIKNFKTFWQNQAMKSRYLIFITINSTRLSGKTKSWKLFI
jgi:hypothetical protein